MEYVIQRHEQRCASQHDHEQVEQYKMFKSCEDREMNRDLYPRLNTAHTRYILRIVSLLNFYKYVASLKGDNVLLCQLIQRWDHSLHALCVLLLGVCNILNFDLTLMGISPIGYDVTLMFYFDILGIGPHYL